MNQKEIKHYGVLGMRWGRRRGELVRNPTMFSRGHQQKIDKWELAKIKSKKGYISKYQKKIDEAKIKILNKRVDDFSKETIRKNRENALKMVMKAAPKDWRVKDEDISKMSDDEIDAAIGAYSIIPRKN